MPLPSELLRAVSSPGGGRVALVLGAGCSVEPPTGIQVSTACSLEIHRLLVADGILKEKECEKPEDLSAVSEAVFKRYGSQRAVVERLRDSYDMKLAAPNDGYLIAAALLCEGAISSIVTLNYDLALSNALSALGAPKSIEIIERPEDLTRQKNTNVYYLHRNVNAEDPETWVLRTKALEEEWRGHWEQIIAMRVLTAPVVLFAGIGTPVAVLIESTKLLCASLPPPRQLFLAAPEALAQSRFFQELGIDEARFVQRPWGALMRDLSDRLLEEHVERLNQAASRKIREDGIPNEDISRQLAVLQQMGIVRLGNLRARWLLYDKPYRTFEESTVGLLADLLLALVTIARVSNAALIILDDGCVEYTRQDRTVVCLIVVSGSGHRGRNAIEVELQSRRSKYLHNPTAVLVGGTSASWQAPLSPPADIISGEMSREDLLRGPANMSYFHIDELRADQARIMKVVP